MATHNVSMSSTISVAAGIGPRQQAFTSTISAEATAQTNITEQELAQSLAITGAFSSNHKQVNPFHVLVITGVFDRSTSLLSNPFSSSIAVTTSQSATGQWSRPLATTLNIEGNFFVYIERNSADRRWGSGGEC